MCVHAEESSQRIRNTLLIPGGIVGLIEAHVREFTERARKARDFFALIVLCVQHTVGRMTGT